MKSALLVIDVQRGLFDAEPRPGRANEVLERIASLTRRAHHAGVPVIYMQHETRGGAMDHGTPGWALESQMTPTAEDYFIRKTTPDSFLRTDLAATLDELKITRLFICGYASEICVDTTTRRAAALGYPVTLVADGHTTHDKPHASAERIRIHHNATLTGISSFGPKIVAVPEAQIDFMEQLQ